ncbi:MAG: alginate O-acetyltransferase AlgX-related protein [Planctomycetia bacterium]
MATVLDPAAVRVHRRRRGFGVAAKAGVALFAFTFALVAAEVLLAVAAPQPTWSRLLAGRSRHFALLSVFEPCDHLPFRLKKNAEDWIESTEFRQKWRVDGEGFRASTTRPTEPPSESALRVVAVGDSFTAGHGVELEEAWPAVLERRWNESAPAGGRRAAVLNAGYAGGHSPDCYYAYLERNFAALRPNAVVVGLFAGNDFFEPMDHFWSEVDAVGLPRRVLSVSRYVDDAGRRRMSAAARPLSYQFPVLRESHLWVLATRATIAAESFAGGFHSPHQAVYSPEMQRAYRRSVDCLVGLHQRLQGRGVPLLVLVIPEAHQVDPTVDGWNARGSTIDVALPQKWAIPELRAAGVFVVDLQPSLREAVAAGADLWSLYYREDRHFTAAGQALAGRVAAEALAALDTR